MRSLLVLSCALAVAAQRPLAAQMTGEPAVDSVLVARQAWSRGLSALQAGRYADAQREVTRAATAWPTQQRYLWGRTVTAALAADSAAVLDALRHYAGSGLGRRIDGDTLLRHFASLPGFADVSVALEANAASLAHSVRVGTLTDSTFWPEGVDHDPRTGSFWLASVRHRTLAEPRHDGSTRELWPRGRRDLGAMLGVRVDTMRHVLWATTSGIPQMADYLPADSGIAALLRIRPGDGVIEGRWSLPPVPGGHVLGDLALGPLGDVYVTDSSQPWLYILRPDADTLTRITSPLFLSLQGVAATPDGSSLYVADYTIGLLVVDLATLRVTRLADAEGTTSLGCDGIVLDRDGAIIAVQNGVTPARVTRFVIDGARRRIVRAEVLDRNVVLADEPTIGTIAGRRFVYVANSQWDKHDDAGRRRPSVALTPPLLLGVPLPGAP